MEEAGEEAVEEAGGGAGDSNRQSLNVYVKSLAFN